MNTEELEKQYIKNYEQKIGIANIIKEQKEIRFRTGGKHGKTWLALSPRILEKDTKAHLNANHEIGYWVNYGDDETYGMFSVESIIKWLTTPDLLLYKLGGRRERIVHEGR